MKWFWSPSARGFFNDEDNLPTCANPVPSDAVEISNDVRLNCLSGQCLSKEIVSGADGAPILQDR